MHQGAVLHLKTLNAQVVGIRTATSLSNSVSTANAQGDFVIITLTILNKTSSPQTFAQLGNEPTALIGHNAQYSENFDAENGPDQNSCVSKNDSPTQPGASLTCDVVYDIPTAAVARARTHGFGLMVVNYGDDLSTNAVSTPSQAGIFILQPLGNS